MIKEADKYALIEDAKTNSILWSHLGWWDFFKADMFGRNYFNLNGRASRKEWWAFTVLSSIYSAVLNILYVLYIFYCTHLDLDNPEDFALFNYGGMVISFYIAIPSIALSFRRFHDFNMSAWWGMLIIPMFFLPFFKGDLQDNRFGKSLYK